MTDELKREDDKVGNNGVPMSPAHKAIYDKMDEMCAVLSQEHLNIMQQHLERYHVVTDQTHEMVEALADVVIGPPKIDPLTHTEFVDGQGKVLRDETKGLRHHLVNGGVPARIRTSDIAKIATTVGIIIAAVIEGLRLVLGG